jgi:hypothetical protein
LYNSKIKESGQHKEKLATASHRLKELMILANATQKHKAFEAVLQLVFECDRNSHEYLTAFHSVLGMALHHSKMYSERVNVDMKRTRLLKRALNEIVEEAESRMHEFSDFSDKRCRSASSPNPVNVYLGNSDDERAEPTRRLNNIMNRLSTEEEDIDVVRTSIRRARNTLRGFGPADNVEDNNYDSDHTDRERVRAVHSNRGTSQQRTTSGVYDAGHSGPAAILPVTAAGNLDLADVLFAAHPEAFNRNLTRPAEDLLHFDAPAPRTAAVSDSSSHHGVVGYSDSPVRPLPVLRVEQQAPPAAPQAEQRGPPVLSVRDLQLNDRSPLSPQSYTPDTSTSGGE